MTTRKKVIIGVIGVVVLAAFGTAGMLLRPETGTTVTVEPVAARDLEAIVSASGKIKAKT